MIKWASQRLLTARFLQLTPHYAGTPSVRTLLQGTECRGANTDCVHIGMQPEESRPVLASDVCVWRVGICCPIKGCDPIGVGLLRTLAPNC